MATGQLVQIRIRRRAFEVFLRAFEGDLKIIYAAVVLENDELWAAWHPLGSSEGSERPFGALKKYVSELTVHGRLARDRKRVGSELPTL